MPQGQPGQQAPYVPPGSQQPGAWGGNQQGGPPGQGQYGGPGQYGGQQPWQTNQPESGGNGKRIAIIIGSVVAVLAVIGAVLYFTGVFGGGDNTASDSSDSSSEQQSDSSDQGDSADADQDSAEQDDTTTDDTTTDDTTTDDSADSGDMADQGGTGAGAASPEDAVRQYMQAVQDGDCDTLRAVVMVPEALQGQEEQFFQGLCNAPESPMEVDVNAVELGRVSETSEEVTLSVGQNGYTGYNITCFLVDGAWKVDPTSIDFETTQ